ncbi:MAG: hypothetical protein NTW87_31725, partial [Planctomycetota bacterium]|nr:hypothetical protein [Planctomycetota bacterium]
MGVPEGDTVAWPQCMRRAGNWFLRQNVFYLLSAFLMLLGCYLISLPHLLTPRPDITELLVLLGVINIYEGLVILACGFILRRLPASREATLLLLIEILFLFDMTFTASSCLTRHFKLGLGVAAAGFVLALLKLYALETGARHALFHRLKRFLIPALLVLYSFQGVLVLHSSEFPALRALCAYAIWLTFGALALLLPPDISDAVPPAAPWWAARSFRCAVGSLSLGLLALQLVAQSWVHRAAF